MLQEELDIDVPRVIMDHKIYEHHEFISKVCALYKEGHSIDFICNCFKTIPDRECIARGRVENIIIVHFF